ncbi:MAG: deoxyribodipyrimidine photo-lyase/cryptochrome family protein [Burkholderiales bacterium]
MLNIVWFKRDLRAVDHAPLARAAAAGVPVLPLWIAEPALLDAPDASARHLGFVRECLHELDAALAALGSRLWTAQGDACAVLAALHRRFGDFELLSHEETGNAASYARDRAVGAWMRAHGLRWTEVPANGVVRRLDDRDRWSAAWMARMQAPTCAAPGALRPPPTRGSGHGHAGNAGNAGHDGHDGHERPDRLDGRDGPGRGVDIGPAPGLAAVPDPATRYPGEPDAPLRQRGGRSEAIACLERFLDAPLARYRAGMASPLTAPDDCSRLSAHLALGTVSVRELVQATWAVRRGETDPARRAGLKSFESRLHWHCHFIQKLESEPAIEHRNPHRGFDGLRNEGELDAAERARLEAWRDGRTGWPIVDACMRMLDATGWLNFRMRAMLVSVAAYPLWLHWREPGLVLARRFVDYEPGIHWPQLHMQAGVTGINATRVYSPARQQHDQDPEGRFVRAWLPELGTGDYPPPIVDWASAAREARDRVWAARRAPGAQRVAQQVWSRHGSRHPQREPVRRPRARAASDPDARQLALGFDDE